MTIRINKKLLQQPEGSAELCTAQTQAEHKKQRQTLTHCPTSPLPGHVKRTVPAMADYHTTYRRGEGETTQWEDLQRKFGNLPPKEPVPKPAAFTPAAEQQKDTQWLDERGEDELQVLEEETSDNRFLEAYRCGPGSCLLWRALWTVSGVRAS